MPRPYAEIRQLKGLVPQPSDQIRRGRCRRCTLEVTQLEQPRTSSKSLSKPFNARSKDLLSASNMNDTGKALYKLTYILNKKLRAVRYFFFVKLETLKKLNLRI